MGVQKNWKPFSEKHPELMDMWDYEKNSEIIDPANAKSDSDIEVWWKCAFGHSHKAQIRSKIRSRGGCPICNSEKSTSFPEQAVLFFLNRDISEDVVEHRKLFRLASGKLLEADVYLPSRNVAIEYDGRGFHDIHGEHELAKDAALKDEFGIDTYHIYEGRSDYVDGNTIVYRQNVSAMKHLSWAISQLYEILGIVATGPIDVKSKTRAINATIRARELRNSFATAHPDLLPEYLSDKNQGLDPRNVREFSHLKVWWKCSVCGNEWETSFAKRASGRGCPKCSAQRNADLKKAPEKGRSWGDVYPKYVYLWDMEKNEGVSPFDVKPSSNQLVWWKCPRCGSTWQGKPNAFRDKKGSGCKGCSATITNLRRYGKPLPDWAREFYPEGWFDKTNGVG